MPSIFQDFLDETHAAAQELAERSDVMRLQRLPLPGMGLWVASFDLPYLRQEQDGTVRFVQGPLEAAIQLGPAYLTDARPVGIVQVANGDLFHPNYRFPFLCVGEVRPGLGLPSVLRHVFEILSYQNYATDHGLNPLACRYLVDHPEVLDLLPPAPRLLRRELELIEG